jgi:hypothetical protein
MRISQLRLRIKKFRALIGQGYFCPLHVQFANDASIKILLLGFELLLKNAHGIFAHPYLCPIEKDIGERNPHIHGDAADDFLKFVVCLVDV